MACEREKGQFEMKRILLTVGLLAIFVLVFIGYMHDQTPTEEILQAQSLTDGQEEIGIREGNVAPDFQLRDIWGESVKLSDFRGKKVILNFWTSWCPPCRSEMPDLQKYYASSDEEDFTIVAVNVTAEERGQEDVINFVNEFHLQFPILMDEKKEAAQTYHVIGYPTNFFIDEDGVIQKVYQGPMSYDFIQEMLFDYHFYSND